MSRRILIDGIETDRIDALDRGLQFGDGLFETMAVTGGRIQLLERHLARLLHGCDRLGMPLPPVDIVRMELSQVAAQLGTGVMKLIVTRGSGPRGYAPPLAPVIRRIVSAAPAPAFVARPRLAFCDTRLATGGSLAGLKHLNRLEQVLAMRELQGSDDFDEGLMLDSAGRVIEAVSANVFIVRGGRVATPRLDRCGVAGIMRELVLELTAQAGQAGEIADLMPDELMAADEIFLTNSLTGIRPVSALADRSWETGPVTRDLRARLRQSLRGDPF